MINWSKSIVARNYATIVDPSTWRDIAEIDIISGSVKYSDSGERVSADIECEEFDPNHEYWIRLYFVARQGSESENIPLFTGIVSIPDITYNGRMVSNKLQCYSPLSLADKVYLPLGWYVREGENGAKIIKELLSQVITAPIRIENIGVEGSGVPIIQERIVAEGNETIMSMVDKIIKIIDWRLIVKGDGSILIATKPTDISQISASFDHDSNDIFEMDVTISNDWYSIPNVYRAVGSGISSVAKDEDPNSRFSIQNRGREIWVNDTDCVLAKDEKIGDYAIRKLKEAQEIHRTLDYSRRFDPNVKIQDLIRINYLDQGISGIFRVKSQTIQIGYGAKVSEQAEGL